MQAVVDSSALISLARAGLLHLAPRLPIEVVLLDVVWDEAVRAGRDGGHVDAASLESVFAASARRPAEAAASVDAAVLAAAVGVGGLVANDLALGRRARNLGVTWLRSADLLMAAVAVGGIGVAEARDGVLALRDSGRIAPALAAEYLEELS